MVLNFCERTATNSAKLNVLLVVDPLIYIFHLLGIFPIMVLPSCEVQHPLSNILNLEKSEFHPCPDN